MSLANATLLWDRVMNKSELCAHVAARAGVSRMIADTVISTTFAMIGEALANDQDCRHRRIRNVLDPRTLGTTGRNPATGKGITIAASQTPAFKAGKKLRGIVNAGK